ncbi:MAG: hypothetical protein ACK5Z5_00775 [Neisseriaceae bacterium]
MESLIKSEENNKGADIIALPSHAATEKIIDKFATSNTALIVTTGVCHNIQVEDLIKEYNLFKKQFLETNKSIGIVLAGDAPDSTNNWFFFTQKEAKSLAKYIVKYLDENKIVGANLLITNGPRTGKFNTETKKEDVQAHRDGNTDLVTKKFMDTLDKSDIKNTTLFDFQYGAQTMFKAILGSLESTESQSEIFMPGESISMISQGLDVLQKTSMIIYENGAMNSTHKEYVKEVHATGKAKVLTQYKEILPNVDNSDVSSQTEYKPAREKVAEQIYNMKS